VKINSIFEIEALIEELIKKAEKEKKDFTRSELMELEDLIEREVYLGLPAGIEIPTRPMVSQVKSRLIVSWNISFKKINYLNKLKRNPSNFIKELKKL